MNVQRVNIASKSISSTAVQFSERIHRSSYCTFEMFLNAYVFTEFLNSPRTLEDGEFIPSNFVLFTLYLFVITTLEFVLWLIQYCKRAEWKFEVSRWCSRATRDVLAMLDVVCDVERWRENSDRDDAHQAEPGATYNRSPWLKKSTTKNCLKATVSSTQNFQPIGNLIRRKGSPSPAWYAQPPLSPSASYIFFLSMDGLAFTFSRSIP